MAVMAGKTIRIFLVNGTSSGMWVAELGNWIGKAFVCYRSQLASLARRS